MALPLLPTLGELRAELLSRIGMASQGAAAGAMVTTVGSFLKRTQEYLYYEFEFPILRKKDDVSSAAGQTLYDWLDNIDPAQIIEVRTLVSGQWLKLTEGIEYQHDTVVDSRSWPRRYDRFAQLEIFPEPDGIYPLRIEHYERLGQFTQDGDRCTLDDNLLFNFTLGLMKQHYGHDDAATYLDMAERRRKKLQHKAIGNKRFVVGQKVPVYQPDPVVV